MLNRLLFLACTTFWVVMNGLLWRAETGVHNRLGAAIPIETVWRKMLLAPDTSSLEIFHRGKRIGTCRWVANVGEERATGQVASEDLPPGGMVNRLTGYTIDCDGNLMLTELGNNARFYARLNLAGDHAWNDFHVRLNWRDFIAQITAAANTQTVAVNLDDAGTPWSHVFQFQDLQQPARILQAFGLPVIPGLLDNFAPPTPTNSVVDLRRHLTWSACHDSLSIGRSSIRVYRLEATLWDRYKAVAYVSRAGEIMRVELPDNLVLINFALTSY